MSDVNSNRGTRYHKIVHLNYNKIRRKYSTVPVLYHYCLIKINTVGYKGKHVRGIGKWLIV